VKSKLKALLKMPLTDRQRRILIVEECLGIYEKEKIATITGISINHIYAELKAMKSQVRSTYLVLTEQDIYNNKDLHLDNNETVDNGVNKPQLALKTNEDYNKHYLDIYNIYPKKSDKRRGEKIFKQLLKKGHTKEFILQCVMNYLESGGENRVKDRDPTYVKSIAVLLGPDEHYLEYAKSSDPDAPPKTYEDETNSISNLLN